VRAVVQIGTMHVGVRFEVGNEIRVFLLAFEKPDNRIQIWAKMDAFSRLILSMSFVSSYNLHKPGR